MDRDVLYTVVSVLPFIMLVFGSLLYWVAVIPFVLGNNAIAERGGELEKKQAKQYVMLLVGIYALLLSMMIWASFKQVRYHYWLGSGRHEVYRGRLSGVYLLDLGPPGKGGARWERDQIIVGDHGFVLNCRRGGSDPVAQRCIAARLGTRIEVDFERFGARSGIVLQVLDLDHLKGQS